MKRSVAMMACVLSGAMVLGSFSPVMAETGAKAVSATVTDRAKQSCRHCRTFHK